MAPEQLWTAEDLWKFLQLSRRTLFTYLKEGRIPQPPIRVNKRVMRWRKADLVDVLTNGPRPIGTYGPGVLFDEGKLVQQEAPTPPANREEPIVRREPAELLVLKSDRELREMVAGDGAHAGAAGEELMRREGLADDAIERSRHFRREFGIGNDQADQVVHQVAPGISIVRPKFHRDPLVQHFERCDQVAAQLAEEDAVFKRLQGLDDDDVDQLGEPDDIEDDVDPVAPPIAATPADEMEWCDECLLKHLPGDCVRPAPFSPKAKVKRPAVMVRSARPARKKKS